MNLQRCDTRCCLLVVLLDARVRAITQVNETDVNGIVEPLA